MPDILDLLGDENAKALAREIVDVFIETADNNTLECKFDISAGKIIKSDANTWFNFDVPKNTKLDDFKKALFERELQPEESSQVEAFIREIQKILEQDHCDTLTKRIRAVLMPANSPKKIPMHNPKISKVEISDCSPVPYFARFTMKIGKPEDTHIDIKKVVERLSELRDELPENADKTANQLFEENKHEDVFAGVVNIMDGHRFLYDASITMFVDYSMSDEFLEAIQVGDIEKIKEFG